MDTLLLTHHHENHMGAAGLLAQRRGLVPRIQARACRCWSAVSPSRRIAHRHGAPAAVRAEALGPEVASGRCASRSSPPPGTAGPRCFFERERGCFSPATCSCPEAPLPRGGRGPRSLSTSLEAVGRLAAQPVSSARIAGPFARSRALRRKAENLGLLRDRVRELLARGLPEREVSPRARWAPKAADLVHPRRRFSSLKLRPRGSA